MSATGKLGQGISWPDFWALFDEEDEKDSGRLREALANSQDFYRWFKRRSTKHQLEVLEGAPLQVTLLLIHCLPQPEARRVAENYPKDKYEALSRAYFNPPQREGTAGQVPTQDLPGLPAGNESGGPAVPIQKVVRGNSRGNRGPA